MEEIDTVMGEIDTLMNLMQEKNVLCVSDVGVKLRTIFGILNYIHTFEVRLRPTRTIVPYPHSTIKYQIVNLLTSFCMHLQKHRMKALPCNPFLPDDPPSHIAVPPVYLSFLFRPS